MRVIQFNGYVCDCTEPEEGKLRGYFFPSKNIAVATTGLASVKGDRNQLYEDVPTINFINAALESRGGHYSDRKDFEVEDGLVEKLIDSIRTREKARNDVHDSMTQLLCASFRA